MPLSRTGLFHNLHLQPAHNFNCRAVQRLIKACAQWLNDLNLSILKRRLQKDRIADDAYIGHYATKLDNIGRANHCPNPLRERRRAKTTLFDLYHTVLLCNIGKAAV